MVSCSAFGCKNRSEHGYLMKIFPKNPDRRKQWAAKVQRRNWTPTKNAYLCEVHFEPYMWEKTRQDGSRKLKYNAVPTIFNNSQQKEESPPMEMEHIILKCEVTYDDSMPTHVQDQKISPDRSSKLKYDAISTTFMNTEQKKEPCMEIERVLVKCEVSYDDPVPSEMQDQKMFFPESVTFLETSAVSFMTLQKQYIEERWDMFEAVVGLLG